MSSLFRVGPVENVVKVVTSLRPSAFNPVALTEMPSATKDKCLAPKTHEAMRITPAGIVPTGLFAKGSRSIKAIYGSPQLRFSHTDVSFPNFDDYRCDNTKDPTVRQKDTEDVRKNHLYLSYGVGGMMGLYMMKNVVHTMVDYKSVAKDMQALAAIEINTADIAVGASQTFMWRGKPVFVRHRTSAQIATEKAVNVSELRDPQTDKERAPLKEDWVVTMGICTHLGCVPIANQGEYGGYYCPCHGSHYDTAGRIRKGPAPLNLEIPEYSFASDDVIIIGSDN